MEEYSEGFPLPACDKNMANARTFSCVLADSIRAGKTRTVGNQIITNIYYTTVDQDGVESREKRQLKTGWLTGNQGEYADQKNKISLGLEWLAYRQCT